MTTANTNRVYTILNNQEIVSNLPEGWGSADLKEIAFYKKGKKPKKLEKHKWQDAVPYIDIEAFETENIRRYANPDSSILVDKGDVVVVWDGARCGHVGKVPVHGALGSTLMNIKPIMIDNDYFLRFLQLSYETINSNPRGTGIPHVDPQLFWSLEMPIAPLPEQKRITAKVEELLARINVVHERLARVKEILKLFRQSVLSAACSGRLTYDWRNKNTDIETAKNLLKRIKKIRLESARTLREKEKIISLYEESEKRSAQRIIEFDLPETWLFCEINELGDVCNGSTPSRKRPEFWGGNIPWTSSGEVRNNLIYDTQETITELGYNKSSVRMLPVGTVLLAMIGEGKRYCQFNCVKF